jgi:hypothetical protein
MLLLEKNQYGGLMQTDRAFLMSMEDFHKDPMGSTHAENHCFHWK